MVKISGGVMIILLSLVILLSFTVD